MNNLQDRRAAWIKKWKDHIHIYCKYECSAKRGMPSDCTCGAVEANKQLKGL